MQAYLVSVRSRDAATEERVYILGGTLSADDVARMVQELLHDPVLQTARWEPLNDQLAPLPARPVVEIALRPGVTDNEAETILIGAQHIGVTGLEYTHTLRRVWPDNITNSEHLRAYAYDHLLNDLIETAYIALQPDPAERLQFYQHLIAPPAPVTPTITHVDLRSADDAALLRISRDGILSLSLAEMQAIQHYFRVEGRDPTDAELETIAQTWSEHCRHKTFRARITYRATSASDQPDQPDMYPALFELESGASVVIDGLLDHYLRQATEAVRTETLLSAFVDNAGIVAFDADYEVSFKVETHNHPSALEPFGGANTGVGGVVRDVLGVSAQPIAITDVLCFGPQDLDESALAPGLLHPQRIRAGVVAGVRDYGNKLGIPTVNGAVLYDEGYVANPLVFCGTVGIAPRGIHPRAVEPGDAIVVIGGRTGRDGIHGATFSSAELTHQTAATVGAAVQIGDPVTEKKVIDVLLQARNLGLYSAITDCGAGGLSSAVGEMGEATGAHVELRDVPLKYPGLQPWEIWISEAQERMVVAVPPEHVQALLTLCTGEDVEATVIGHFTDDAYLNVRYNSEPLVDLAMDFLHSGGVRLELEAEWQAEVRHQKSDVGARRASPTAEDEGQNAAIGHQASGNGDQENRSQKSEIRSQTPPTDHRLPPTDNRQPTTDLLNLLAHPIIASKEDIIRTYDHEVQGATILKPLVGANNDGPGDAAALQPRIDSRRGIVVGCGINPRYGRIDPYWMALAAVDEALRNVVAAGGDPAQVWLLDNFCWGDPKLADRLGGLVRAAAGCYDAALAYRTPFISGKDSLNNEYRDADGTRTAIPPTLLISALAIVPDVLRTVSMDAKTVGNQIYLVGTTRAELGGALWGAVGGADNRRVPQVDLALAPRILAAVHRVIADGLVRACHDLSEGGLGVAAAEMAFAGAVGMELDLRHVPADGDLDDATLLWSESPSRLLLEVEPQHSAAVESLLADLPWANIGRTITEPLLNIAGQSGDTIIRTPLDELKTAWQSQ